MARRPRRTFPPTRGDDLIDEPSWGDTLLVRAGPFVRGRDALALALAGLVTESSPPPSGTIADQPGTGLPAQGRRESDPWGRAIPAVVINVLATAAILRYGYWR